MPHAATQPAHDNPTTKAGWWAALTLAAMKLGHKALQLWQFRASVESRLFRRLESALQARIGDLDYRIARLEEEKTALQAQNANQGARIAALEDELKTLREELKRVTGERDEALAELAERDEDGDGRYTNRTKNP
jgi:chromosome segregation ATPase